MDSRRSKMMQILEVSLVSKQLIQFLVNYPHFISPDPDTALAKAKYHRGCFI